LDFFKVSHLHFLVPGVLSGEKEIEGHPEVGIAARGQQIKLTRVPLAANADQRGAVLPLRRPAVDGGQAIHDFWLRLA